MNALETGLYSKLIGNSALTTLLGGSAVYNEIAPASTPFPYVVFQKQSNVPAYTIKSGTAYENALYTVKGISSSSPAFAGSIAAAIDSALNMQTLTISGYTNILTRREGDVSYPEVVSGQVLRHRGGEYRIQADPA